MRAVLLPIFLAALVSLVAIPLLVSAFTFTRPLAYGSSGSDVSALQQYLQTQGYFHYPDITGYFGPYTWRALAAFQWDNKLEPVGYLGPKTELALNKLLDQSLASLATSTSAASTAATATSTISLVPTPPPALTYTTPPPAPAVAQPWQAVSGGGGGGPPAATPAPTPPPAPAPYIAQAVHFDGNTNLTKLDNAVLYSNAFTYSAWVKFDTMSGFTDVFRTRDAFDGNGEGTEISNAFNFDPPATDLGIGFETAFSPSLTGGSFGGGTAEGVLDTAHWHHIFISANSHFPDNSRLLNMYIDGVSVLDPTLSYDGCCGNHDNAPITNGSIITIPGPLTSQIISPAFYPMNMESMSDVQVWLGQYIDPTVPGNLDKFIADGRPVDPAVAEAAFGQPAILFSGDSSNFVTNQGTDGPFTLVGTLTNSDTSPSN